MSATADKAKTTKPTNDQPPMELLAEVARRAALSSIQCRAIRAALLVDDTSSGVPLQAHVQPEARFRMVEDGRRLLVRIKAGMTGAYTFGERKVDVVTAEVEFELSYALEAGEPLSHQALEAFAAVNGTFNAWPFIREALFTETARLGLAPFVLGLRKIGQPQPE